MPGVNAVVTALNAQRLLSQPQSDASYDMTVVIGGIAILVGAALLTLLIGSRLVR